MDWNKMGAIGSLIGGIFATATFAWSIWPWPQIKAHREQGTGPMIPQTALGPKLIAILLVVSFILSAISIYGAWHGTTDWMMSVNDWNDYPFKKVANRRFRQETVVLDGNNFTDCEFDQVTLVYSGEPFKFSGTSHINGVTVLRTNNARLLNYLILLGKLGLLDQSAHTAMPTDLCIKNAIT